MATETATETAGDATPTAATATSEEAEAPRRVDGTVGKTIEDFVEGFNFKETPSGRKYVTFVKNKYWPNYKKEKKLGEGLVEPSPQCAPVPRVEAADAVAIAVDGGSTQMVTY